MKKLLLLVLMLILGILHSEGLGVYVDSNRFFGEGETSQVEINYSIPYHEMDFIRMKYGYEAEIFVDILIKHGENEVSSDSFTNKVVLTDALKMFSDEEYLDKITITLPSYKFTILVEFEDVHTETTYLWEHNYEPLGSSSLVSDLEFSSYIKADTTSYLEKFHRGGKFYNVRPNQTFSQELGMVSYYQEVNDLFEDELGNSQLEQQILIKNNQVLVDSISQIWKIEQGTGFIEGQIDISELAEGYYDLEIFYRDALSGIKAEVSDYICVKADKEEVVRLFPELEHDLMLAKYFMNANEKSTLKTLSDEGIENFISKYWKSKDPNPATDNNEFLEEVSDRILYANQFYTHFKEGWTTDRGRIYIKYGKPYEVRKLTTGGSEHEFSEKVNEDGFYFNKSIVRNYEIWKYRLKRNATYVFIDTITSGNYKLIYSSDDSDGETTVADWESYLDFDFDERLLE